MEGKIDIVASTVLPEEVKRIESETTPEVNSRNRLNSVQIDAEIRKNIIDSLRPKGVLFDIGKPSYTRNKEEMDKDLHSLVRYNIDLGDGSQCVRHVIMALLQTYRDPSKLSEHLNSAYKDDNKLEKIRSFSAVFSAYSSTTMVSEECDLLCEYSDSKTESMEELHGKDMVKWIMYSKLMNTFDLNRKFSLIIVKYIDGEINLADLVSDYCLMMMKFYIKRYGHRMAISYISLFYRVSLVSGLKFIENIGKESYDLMGIYDYNTYSTRGLFNEKMSEIFLELKVADARMQELLKLKNSGRNTGLRGRGRGFGRRGTSKGFHVFSGCPTSFSNNITGSDSEDS